MYKLTLLASILAYANAGVVGVPAAVGYAAAPVAYGHAVAPYAVTSQHSNVLRSYGNLGQVSTYSKTVDTPFSSVSKSDVRVSNPGYATVAHAPVAAYAAHAPFATYAAHAPVAAYAAPAVVAKTYAPAVAAAPVVAARTAYAAPVAHAGLLGVAYSAAPLVSHMTYSNSYGLQYGW